jgi:hypothetical protein
MSTELQLLYKLEKIKSITNTGLISLIIPGSTSLSTINQLCV